LVAVNGVSCVVAGSSPLEGGRVPIAQENKPRIWASGHHGELRRAAHGYEATREAAMAAFAMSWRRS
jgi:hypothetical protein